MKTSLMSFALAAILAASTARSADEVSPFIRKTGGLVMESMAGKPGVLVLNAQKEAGPAVVASEAEAMQKLMRIPFNVTAAETPKKGWFETASMMAAEKTMVGVVILCDAEGLPSLLVAPESKWAIVNVAALKADQPKPEVLEARIKKEFWRAGALALGAANSEFQVCLMKPVFQPSDLDAVSATAISLEPMAGIRQQLKALGVTPARQTFYRKACEEGWAPPPANPIQQAVWDEVKAAKKE